MSNHLVPLAYYAYWIILVVMLVLILAYWALRPKSRTPGSNTRLLAGILVLLTGLLYALEQMPMWHTHFDALTGKFVVGYHEPLTQGFVRFWYKVVIAMLLLSYAFRGVKKPH